MDTKASCVHLWGLELVFLARSSRGGGDFSSFFIFFNNSGLWTGDTEACG